MALALVMFLPVTNDWKFDKHTKLCPRGCLGVLGEVPSTCRGKTLSTHFTIFNNRANPLRQINVIIKSL